MTFHYIINSASVAVIAAENNLLKHNDLIIKNNLRWISLTPLNVGALYNADDDDGEALAWMTMVCSKLASEKKIIVRARARAQKI